MPPSSASPGRGPGPAAPPPTDRQKPAVFLHFNQPCDEGVIRSRVATKPCARRAGPWVLAATILGSSMAFIDGTAVSVALPVLQTDLSATVSQLQWVVEAYALFLAALLLVGGSLGDRIGRRRTFASGVVVFTLASVWCGLAPNAEQLIAARAVQGIGAALLVPGSLAIISASFAEEARGKAIGTWAGFTAITAALGPVLGGWLVTNLSWRWVFFINIPLAVVVLALLFTLVDESRDEQATGRLDWPGAALSVVGLGGLIYGFIESANYGLTHGLVLGALGMGAAGLIAFVLVELRVAAPMVQVAMFKSRNFTGANLLTLLLYGALGGSLFFLPFNLIQVQGYSVTAAGAAFLPFIVIIAVLSRWAGGLTQRYGAKAPLVVGPAIAAAGFGLLAVPGIGGSYWTTFFPGVVALGLGMAICVTPLVTVVMGSADASHAGAASGVNNAISRTASLLAIAVMGVVALATFNGALDDRLAVIDPPAPMAARLEEQRNQLAGIEVPVDLAPELTVSIQRAIDESFVAAFRVVMLAGGGMALGSSLIALLFIQYRPPQAQYGPPEETTRVS